jgi:hypothetical protein
MAAGPIKTKSLEREPTLGGPPSRKVGVITSFLTGRQITIPEDDMVPIIY